MGILKKIILAMNSANNAPLQTSSETAPYTATTKELDKLLVDSNKVRIIKALKCY